MVSKSKIAPDGRSINRYMPTIGVYEILHWNSNRRYVGSSQEVEKRLYLHVVMLRTGKHHCQFLQRVWNKYPEEQFEFFLLEECHLDVLVEREQLHMDSASRYELMNTKKGAGANWRGLKHSDESKRKMSEAAKRSAATPEQRLMRSERAKRQHATGIMPYKLRRLKLRTCIICLDNFTPPRRQDGRSVDVTKFCNTCRDEYGGKHNVRRIEYFRYNFYAPENGLGIVRPFDGG